MGSCSSEAPSKTQTSSSKFEVYEVQRSDFTFAGMLGKGTFGSVWKVFDHRSKSFYALKIIDKVKCISGKNVRRTMLERDMLVHLADVDTEFIVKLHAAFQDDTKLYLMMDFI